MRRPAGLTSETTPNWAGAARRRAPFYILAAVLLAALAGVLTFLYLDRLWSNAVPTATALVARQAIRPGALIQPDSVELREVPEGVLPERHLTGAAQAIGRTAVVPISAGEVILEEKLSGDTEARLSARLPDGRWAMLMPVAWLVGPLPSIGVGDRIDLVAYQSGQPARDAGVVVTAVEVLELAENEGGAERLTLAVTLEEAVSILVAHANGFNLLGLLRPQGG